MPASARRGSFSESQGLAIIDAPRRLLVCLDQDIVRAALAQSALTLGMAHRLPAYHASYLEVALRRALRLATLDERLKQATSTTGVALVQPAPS